MYVLLNLKRRKLGVRELVTLLEQTVVNTLVELGIEAHPRADAPWCLCRGKENLLTGFTYSTRLFIPRSGINVIWIFHHFYVLILVGMQEWKWLKYHNGNPKRRLIILHHVYWKIF